MVFVEELDEELPRRTAVPHVDVSVGICREGGRGIKGRSLLVRQWTSMQLDADVGSPAVQAELHALPVGNAVPPDLEVLVVRNAKVSARSSNLTPESEIIRGVCEEPTDRENGGEVGGLRNQHV